MVKMYCLHSENCYARQTLVLEEVDVAYKVNSSNFVTAVALFVLRSWNYIPLT